MAVAVPPEQVTAQPLLVGWLEAALSGVLVGDNATAAAGDDELARAAEGDGAIADAGLGDGAKLWDEARGAGGEGVADGESGVDARGFFIRVAAEVFLFHHLGGGRIHEGQLLQDIVEGDQFLGPFDGELTAVLDGDLHALPLGSVMGAGAIDENASHLLGGDFEKVAFTIGTESVVGEHMEVGLVDERRCLECEGLALVAQNARGDLMELLIDRGDELITGRAVAGDG